MSVLNYLGKTKLMVVYKIRRNSDGMFSSGGQNPDWRSEGKVWNRLNHVKSHLKNLSSYRNPDRYKEVYKDCDLVTYVLEEIKAEAIR